MNNAKIIDIILRGLPNTLYLLILSFMFATILGILLAWLGLRQNQAARGVANIYLGLIRGPRPY